MLSFCSLWSSFLSSNSLVTHKQLSSLIQHRMSFVVSTAHDSRFACKIFLRCRLYHTLPIAQYFDRGTDLCIWLTIFCFQTGPLQMTRGGASGRSSRCSSERVPCTGHVNNRSSVVVWISRNGKAQSEARATAYIMSGGSKPSSVFCPCLSIFQTVAPFNCKPDVPTTSVLPVVFSATMMVDVIVHAMVASMSVDGVLVLVAKAVEIGGFGTD